MHHMAVDRKVGGGDNIFDGAKLVWLIGLRAALPTPHASTAHLAQPAAMFHRGQKS